MKLFTFFMICLVAASVGASDYSDDPIGTIEKAGYDYQNPSYIDIPTQASDYSDIQASVLRVNEFIPGQIIAINLMNTGIENSLINENNVESSASTYLTSIGVGTGNAEITLISKKFVMNKIWFLSYMRSVNGVYINDGGLKLGITPNGNISLLMGNVTDTDRNSYSFIISEERALNTASVGVEGVILSKEILDQSILPIYFADNVEYHPAYKIMVVTDNPYAEWETFVDANSGDILKRENKVYYDVVDGNIAGSIQPLTPFDPWEDRDFFHQNIEFGSFGMAETDMNGNYSFDVPGNDPVDVTSRLSGPFLNVINSAGPSAMINDNITPSGTYDVYWDDSNSDPAERDAWYSATYIHNWIKTLDPDLVEMDFSMNCYVNVSGSCNAFWSGQSRTINFFSAGGGCPNIAQIADVVYHEYGHGITDLQYRPWSPNGAMHEGFSDYLACTATNQPLVGLGFFGQGSHLRNLDNTNRYPENWSGQVHNDGLIIGGALWHTREVLSPYPMGYTDSLWHFAREAHPGNYEEYFWAFVALDDDDGNINNGTPNDDVIFYNFGDRHGVGPGSTVGVVADSLFDTEDTQNGYLVIADVSTFFSPLPDSVLLYYNAGSGYSSVNMVQSGIEWEGVIPAQNHGTTINYYVYVVNEAGFMGTAPENAPTNFYTFQVIPDVIDPTIEFIAGQPNTVNLFGSYGPFLLSAWDVNGINPSTVTMRYFVNSENESTVSMSAGINENEFVFESLDLQRQLESGDIVNYYFTAEDEATTPNSGRYPETGTLNFTMADTELFETFDVSGIDFWAFDGDWSLSSPGRNSPNCIVYGPLYENNVSHSIQMTSGYNLSPYSSASISFWRRNVIRDGDTCFVYISNNGGTSWTNVGAFSDTAASYRNQEYDITNTLSPSGTEYLVRFTFESDDQGQSIGVFIDDISWNVNTLVGIDDEIEMVPEQMFLSQNYPNPFNPQTNISFGLPGQSAVKLEIYDLLGRKVVTLIDNELEAGEHSVVWDGRDSGGNKVSSGIFFYNLTTEYGIKKAKMTLLK